MREQRIESRRVATDAAIIDAVLSHEPRTVLDLGCGEGWLARALAARGIMVTGVDASPALIEAAKQLGGAAFHVRTYDELLAGPRVGQFDLAVANFALLDDDLRTPLGAVRRLLRPGGTLVIQTVHPFFVAADAPYASGWRTETFAGFAGDWPEPMPWYFRTLSAWLGDLSGSGFTVGSIREPLDARGFRPLSIVFDCSPQTGGAPLSSA